MTYKLTEWLIIPKPENNFFFPPQASCVHNTEEEKAVTVNGTIAYTVLCGNL